MSALADYLARFFDRREAGEGAPRPWGDAALGLFVLAAAGLLIGLAFVLGGIHWGRHLTVTARFTDATGLTDGAPVVVAGVPVGRVTGLAVRHGLAIVTLEVSPDADLRADMTAAIRSKTLLGERVVELQPGSPTAPALQDGAVLLHTLPSTEPDDLMAGVAPFLSKVNPDDVAALVHAAGQAARSGQLDRAVDSLARLDSMLAEAQPRLTRLLDELDRTAPAANHLVTGLDAELPALGVALTRANGVMAQAPGVLADTDRLVGHVDRLALALDTVASASPHLVRQTSLVLDRLPATLDRLDRLADQLSDLTLKVGPTLDVLNEPALRHLLRDEGIRVHFGPF